MQPSRLGERLFAVAQAVQAWHHCDGANQRSGAWLHADIGTNHAYLPIFLVGAGLPRCLATEWHAGPLALAAHNLALSGLGARIALRHGSGLVPVEKNEVSSLSLCGMGGLLIRKLLSEAAWLPACLVLQPNSDAAALRRWAYEHHYHLQEETLIQGSPAHLVMSFRLAAGPDPAYSPFLDGDSGLGGEPLAQLEAAFYAGPLLLRRRDALLKNYLSKQLHRLQPLLVAARENPEVASEWAWVKRAHALIELNRT